MPWDTAHQRGAGFTVQVLRPPGVYGILANLTEFPHLRPVDLTRLLIAADAADAPLAGRRGFDLYVVSHRLALLRASGLVVRCDSRPSAGRHSRYEITRLGAGMIESLAGVTEWGMDDYNLAVAAARSRAGLPGVCVPVDPVLRRPRTATGLALGLLDMRWSFALLSRIRMAGAGGVEASEARDAINAALDAIPERVRHRLNRSAQHRVLRYLESAGLIARHGGPQSGRPGRVLYSTTEAGMGLMKALWQVGEWGIPHDAELSEAMMVMSTWFEPD